VSRIKDALNEGRILILGTQVFLGFHFRSFLEPRFEGLPDASQWLSLVGLALLIVTFGLLVAPAAYHQIVERGVPTAALHRFATLTIGAALLPLAVAFGMSAYIGAERVGLDIPPAAAAAVVVGTALGCWYALPLALRGRATRRDAEEEDMTTSLTDRIDHVLTEIRMVLPGAQALLGFGFAAILMERFDHLPRSSQLTHLVGVGFVLLATIFLMTPASRHRIAERGHPTEAFHRFTSRVLVLSMALLALGVAAQVLVVVRRIEDSLPLAAGAAAATLVFCFGLWFGLTAWLRARRRQAVQPTDAATRRAA
jgi:hypothetical protein